MKRLFILFLLLFPLVIFAQDVNRDLSINYPENDCDSLVRHVKRLPVPTAVNAYGDTYLHVLARRHDNCAQYAIAALIERGALVNAANRKGWTPLDEAAYAYESTTIITLLEHGGSLGAPVPGAPITRAIESKDYDLIRRICRRHDFFYDFSDGFVGVQLAYSSTELVQASLFGAFSAIDWIPEQRIGYSVGTEFSLEKNRPLFGTKVSLDYRYLFAVGRVSYIYYYDHEQHVPAVSLDGGLSVFSAVELTVGRNFYFGNDPFGLQPFHITAWVQIPFFNYSTRSFFRLDEMHNLR